MKQNQKNVRLAKFLAYVLGRRPDEFGLVPDREGYVKIKDLLKALHEEEGCKHIRISGINEIRMTLPDPGIEIQDNLIRALKRENLPVIKPARDMPKLLYTCIRPKAQPFVMDKGIRPMGHEYVILSRDRNLAQRMGRRLDKEPVLLTVNVPQAVQMGTMIQEAGEMIHLARSIPPGCFTGPPLPREKPEAKAGRPGKTTREQTAPGSIFPDFSTDAPNKKGKGRRGRSKDPAWKKDRKKVRRQKEKMWPED